MVNLGSTEARERNMECFCTCMLTVKHGEEEEKKGGGGGGVLKATAAPQTRTCGVTVMGVIIVTFDPAGGPGQVREA